MLPHREPLPGTRQRIEGEESENGEAGRRNLGKLFFPNYRSCAIN